MTMVQDPPARTLDERPEVGDVLESRARTFILGIDGATFRIVDYLIARGELPHIAALMRDGVRAPLESTNPPITPAAWTAFATGTNPGRHGIVDFIERRPDSYQGRPIRSTSVPEPRMWDLLSKQGKRVIVYNVPITYPPHQVNGVIISGMDTPSLRNRFVYPAALQETILAKFPDYAIDVMVNPAWGTTKDELAKQLGALLDVRLRVLDYLLETQEWDFCTAVFIATDRFQHAFWKHIEGALQGNNSGPVDVYGEALFDAYRRLDAKLGQLRARYGGQTTWVIVSDHGFGPLDTYVNLKKILTDGGFLKFEDGAVGGTMRSVWQFRKSPLLRGVKGLVRKVAPSVARDIAHTMSLSGDRIDWTKTVAYSFDYFGSIYLNVKGREPQGCVAPEDYEAVREKVMAYLRSIVDPRDGQPVFTQLWKKEEIYTGPRTERLPDIVLAMRDYSYMARRDVEMKDRIFLSLAERVRDDTLVSVSGEHRPDGVLVLCGPQFSSGIDLGHARIIDVAPTVLHAMGQPVPETMDGSVLARAFRPAYLAEHPVRWNLAPDPVLELEVAAVDMDDEYSDEDEELVTERLRGLGYVE